MASLPSTASPTQRRAGDFGRCLQLQWSSVSAPRRLPSRRAHASTLAHPAWSGPTQPEKPSKQRTSRLGLAIADFVGDCMNDATVLVAYRISGLSQSHIAALIPGRSGRLLFRTSALHAKCVCRFAHVAPSCELKRSSGILHQTKLLVKASYRNTRFRNPPSPELFPPICSFIRCASTASRSSSSAPPPGARRPNNQEFPSCHPACASSRRSRLFPACIVQHFAQEALPQPGILATSVESSVQHCCAALPEPAWQQ